MSKHRAEKRPPERQVSQGGKGHKTCSGSDWTLFAVVSGRGGASDALLLFRSGWLASVPCNPLRCFPRSRHVVTPGLGWESSSTWMKDVFYIECAREEPEQFVKFFSLLLCAPSARLVFDCEARKYSGLPSRSRRIFSTDLLSVARATRCRRASGDKRPEFPDYRR